MPLDINRQDMYLPYIEHNPTIQNLNHSKSRTNLSGFMNGSNKMASILLKSFKTGPFDNRTHFNHLNTGSDPHSSIPALNVLTIFLGSEDIEFQC